MTHRSIATILILLVAAPAAYGADLLLSLGGAVEYDDNALRRGNDEEDDVLYQLRPGVRIVEERGHDLTFGVGYAVPFEWAVDNNDELRDEDHLVDGDFAYRANSQVSFFGSDDFGYLRSGLRRDRFGTGGTEGGFDPDINLERDRVTRNDGRLGMNYAFSPRTQSTFVATSTFFDPSREDRSRVFTVGGTAQLTHRLTLAHQVGGGVGYTRQEFDDREAFAGSSTDTYRAFATWRWIFDDTLSLEVSAGPSYLRQDQDSSPAVRNRFALPFEVVSGRLAQGVKDRTNADRSGAIVGAGSLLVPSFALDNGSQNCESQNGQVVALGCSPNVVLDSANGGDLQVINAVRSTQVPLTNANPAGDSGSNLTVFAEATLAKDWTPTLATALGYERRQGNASGLGSTAVTDEVSLTGTWKFWSRWTLVVRGAWVRRESVFDSVRTFDRVFLISETDLDPSLPLGQVRFAGLCDPSIGCAGGSSFNSDARTKIDTERYAVLGRITHRLFRSTYVYGQVRYDDQESERRTLGRTTDFENFVAGFGVRHHFEPIKLW